MIGRAGTVVGVGDRRSKARSRVAAVIGGAGFIGSHLSETLLARGRLVVCIDNFERGSVHNLAGLVGEPGALVVSHDAHRRIPDDLPRFDEIYHLVPPPRPRGDADGRQLRRTARMALRVLDRAARDGASVLLAAPAPGDGGPWPEDVRPAAGGPPKGGTTGDLEQLFRHYAAKRGATVKVARIDDTYGPRMPADRGCEVADFLVRALRGEGIQIGDATQKRRLCFVGDVVEDCVRLMEAPAEDQAQLRPAADVSLVALALAIVELAGTSSTGRSPHAGFAPGLSAQGRASPFALAGTPLRDGLRLTLDDFAARLGVPARRSPRAPCDQVVAGTARSFASSPG